MLEKGITCELHWVTLRKKSQMKLQALREFIPVNYSCPVSSFDGINGGTPWRTGIPNRLLVMQLCSAEKLCPVRMALVRLPKGIKAKLRSSGSCISSLFWIAFRPDGRDGAKNTLSAAARVPVRSLRSPMPNTGPVSAITFLLATLSFQFFF